MIPFRTLILWLTALLLSLAATHSAQAVIPPWEIESLPATTAPKFSLPALTGAQVDSASFTGKVLLINFWATWCAPCREEMPALEKLYLKFKDQGLVVIGIAIDSEKSSVKDFVAKTKTGFPVLHDPELKSHDAYKVFTYPTTFLVDRKGIILQYWIGGQDWNSGAIDKIISNSLR